ncbi:MAG: magnesium transporter CorA family protein [Alphaproteobacteria bacterium]
MLTIYRDSGKVQSSHAGGLPEDVIWLDLLNATEQEKASVESRTGLRVPSFDALSEIESSSRLIVDHGVIYLSTPLVAPGEAGDYQLTPAGFILSQSVLVTVRFAELPSFKAVAENVNADESIRSGAGVFTALMEGFVDRGADILEHLSSELNDISKLVFRAKTRRRRNMARSNERLRHALASVGIIGERLSVTRDVFLGLDRIVPFVLSLKHEWIMTEFGHRLEAVSKDVASLNAFEEHLATKVQFLLDAVLGFINIAQNDLFKILTIVSVVGIPPTVVAGIYGMNFKFMPELNWAWGYPFGLAMIVLSAVLPLLWFKWRGWF